MMLGYRYPVPGLQVFTKVFGQPLYEPETEEHEVEDVQEVFHVVGDQNDPRSVASRIEKSLGFAYDSDEESDISGGEDSKNENNDEFLAEHADILPQDSPIGTINTLKALKTHIETSENRSFTNLERQLLATIVQHGIFNSKTDDNTTSETENSATKNSAAKNSAAKRSVSKNPAAKNSAAKTQKTEIPTSSNSRNSDSTSRRTLLPTPGSYDEASHALMDQGTGRNFSKTSLPIATQRKLTAAVKSLKKTPKLSTLKNSYHPDDEPTLQILESMKIQPVNDGPAYDDLLNSFVSAKKIEEQQPEPKYKSKTRILPPPEFLNHPNHISGPGIGRESKRRVVKREEYGKEQTRPNSGKRRVKVGYREPPQPPPDTERTRKRQKSSNSDQGDKEKAVDILANLITQQFINKMSNTNRAESPKRSPPPPATAVTAPVLAAPLTLTAPLPIVTTPMMGHPGPVLRQDLVSIKLSHDLDKSEAINIPLPESENPQNDIEEGEID